MFRLEVLPECGSTNAELLARRDADFHGLALLALRQTAGYGRRGDPWESGAGNLALSFGLRLPASAVLLLSFVTGLALWDSLRALLPDTVDLRLKWPNDVYLDGQKVSGLLAQVRQSGDSADLVVGVGVNLAWAPAGMNAVALSSYVPAPDPEIFARGLLRNLEARLPLSEDFSALRVEWEKAARLQGAELLVLGEEGVFRAQRLLASGELEVRAPGGELRRLSSENVSLRFAHPSL